MQIIYAQVAELVDALVSGTSVSNDVQVRVLSWAPKQNTSHCKLYAYDGIIFYRDPIRGHKLYTNLNPSNHEN